MTNTLISGELGVALLIEEKELMCVHPRRVVKPTPHDVSRLQGFGFSLSTLRGYTREELFRHLEVCSSAYRASLLIRSASDKTLSAETRALCISDAQELLDEDSVRSAVQSILLFDMDGSVDSGTNISVARAYSNQWADFLTEIRQLVAYVSPIRNAWAEGIAGVFDSEESRLIERTLIESGFFLVIARHLQARDASGLNNSIVNFCTTSPIATTIPNAPLVLNNFRRILGIKPLIRPSDQREAEIQSYVAADPKGRMEQAIAAFKTGDAPTRASRLAGSERKDRATREIDRINYLSSVHDIDSAESVLENLVEFQLSHANADYLAMSLCNIVSGALRAEEFEFAEMVAKLALSLEVSDPATNNSYAVVLKAQGRLTEALEVYDKTIRDYPESIPAHNGRADVLKVMGRPLESLAAYEETLKRFPPTAVMLGGKAEALKLLGRFEESIAIYESLLDLAGKTSPNVTAMADALRLSGRLNDALTLIESLISSENQSTEFAIYHEKARVLSDLGRTEEAIALLRASVDRFLSPYAFGALAQMLKGLGRLEDALAVYRVACEKFPRNRHTLTATADVLKDMGRYQEALSVYNLACARFSSSRVPRTARADLLGRMGRHEEALAELDEIVRAFPSEPRARLTLASLLIRTGRFSQARQYLPKGVPSSESEWYGHHMNAMVDLKEGKLLIAVQSLTYGVKNAPWQDHRLAYQRALAVAQIRSKQYEEALKTLGPLETPVNELQQRRNVFFSHAKAAIGLKDEAAFALNSIGKVFNPQLARLKLNLERRFDLVASQQSLFGAVKTLDIVIEQDEFELALVA